MPAPGPRDILPGTSAELRRRNQELEEALELERGRVQWRDEEIAWLKAELGSRRSSPPQRTTMRHSDTFGEITQSIMIEAAKKAGEQAAIQAFVQKRKDDDHDLVEGFRGGRKHVLIAVACAMTLFFVTMIGWALLSQVNIHVTPKGHTEAP
jgi:hypothetical protein